MPPFSKRQGYAGQPKEITVREEAPANLRAFILQTVKRQLGFSWSALRQVLCQVLLEAPNKYNWTEDPNIREEVESLLEGCEWFKVYDFIEGLSEYFAECDHDTGSDCVPRFSEAINTFFLEKGIGWQLSDGEIVVRGPEAFERAVNTAAEELREDARTTAAGQIHEALQALSRRPEANFRGAIFHGMGALECIARDLAGDQKLTLGQVLKRRPGLLPKPVDDALSQLWGYASNEARHVAEGREPNREDAELIVGLAAAVATYLTRKNRDPNE
jgi:hypothetical protein